MPFGMGVQYSGFLAEAGSCGGVGGVKLERPQAVAGRARARTNELDPDEPAHRIGCQDGRRGGRWLVPGSVW